MTEKEIGCDNCYYSYFDEKAYPCSLCIRGIERTDKWQPNKKTKADAPTIDIVRCKECKHWRNEHICMAWSRYGTIETKADQFCSYGEREGE